MRVAIIPARGGSKRIPRKNIKIFNGRPIISWSIEAARLSGLFDRIIVSTDDDEIANVAIEWGAEIPYIRPVELSDDFSNTTDVVAHGIRWLLNEGIALQSVCCIYATAPLIQVEDIKRASRDLDSGNWDYVFTATDFAAPVFRSFEKTIDGGVRMVFPEYLLTRSQDLPKAFHDAGQFYWGSLEAWIESRPILNGRSKAIIIPRWRVQDIDTFEDWNRAELISKLVLAHPI